METPPTGAAPSTPLHPRLTPDSAWHRPQATNPWGSTPSRSKAPPAFHAGGGGSPTIRRRYISKVSNQQPAVPYSVTSSRGLLQVRPYADPTPGPLPPSPPHTPNLSPTYNPCATKFTRAFEQNDGKAAITHQFAAYKPEPSVSASDTISTATSWFGMRDV